MVGDILEMELKAYRKKRESIDLDLDLDLCFPIDRQDAYRNDSIAKNDKIDIDSAHTRTFDTLFMTFNDLYNTFPSVRLVRPPIFCRS